MNILYPITTYPPAIGGAQLHQHLLAQQLQKKHPIQVVTHWTEHRTDWLLGTTLKAPEKNLDYILDNINIHQIGLSRQDKLKLLPWVFLYYPFMDLALPKVANCLEKYLAPYAEKADLIHNVRIGREGISYAAFQLAKKQNIPFILTPVHHPRWVGWRYRAYNKLYQLADALIALTQSEKQILINLGVPESKIMITGIGPILAETANPNYFKEKYQINDPIILFLGQHYPYKGYQQLLAATKLVWQKIPEAQFVFIGPSVGKSEEYFQTFIDPRIHPLGAVSLQDKTDALAACSLLCVPSSQESFGGVYTEAWNFAKPVIGCNIPAVSEVIDRDINGYLVQQNLAEIAAAIAELLLNPIRAETMGKAGQNKLQAKFTWDKLAAKTEDLYQKLCS